MYGIKPSDLQYFEHLRGADITQICVGSHDIQFNFHPRGNISVQGRCELQDASGTVLDIWEESTHSGNFRFPDILKTPVLEVHIDSSKSFVLKFANTLCLRVIDTSDQYESFSVGNLYV
jgi:hypothetical protein